MISSVVSFFSFWRLTITGRKGKRPKGNKMMVEEPPKRIPKYKPCRPLKPKPKPVPDEAELRKRDILLQYQIKCAEQSLVRLNKVVDHDKQVIQDLTRILANLDSEMVALTEEDYKQTTIQNRELLELTQLSEKRIEAFRAENELLRQTRNKTKDVLERDYLKMKDVLEEIQQKNQRLRGLFRSELPCMKKTVQEIHECISKSEQSIKLNRVLKQKRFVVDAKKFLANLFDIKESENNNPESKVQMEKVRILLDNAIKTIEHHWMLQAKAICLTNDRKRLKKVTEKSRQTNKQLKDILERRKHLFPEEEVSPSNAKKEMFPKGREIVPSTVCVELWPTVNAAVPKSDRRWPVTWSSLDRIIGISQRAFE